jgi:hypothetical protein
VPSSTGWLAAGNGWLFLLGQEDPTLLTYKLNLPDRPNKLGELNLEGFIRPTSALLLVDDRLYVQHNSATLAVVDVSVPEVPCSWSSPAL